MMSRDAVLSDPAICRPSVGDVSSSTGTVIGWIAVPLFGTYYIPENGTVKGMNCVRINLSHATKESALHIIDNVREVRRLTHLPLAVMYDTKGPEFRTLEFINGGISLKKGELIKMNKKTAIGNNFEFSVNHPEAIDKIEIGDKVLIDNALFELEVVNKNNDEILLKALNDGEIKNYKTINVPGVDLNLPFISETDFNDIVFASTHSCDYLALSFVNTKEDVLKVKDIIMTAGGDAKIISKRFRSRSSIRKTTNASKKNNKKM